MATLARAIISFTNSYPSQTPWHQVPLEAHMQIVPLKYVQAKPYPRMYIE